MVPASHSRLAAVLVLALLQACAGPGPRIAELPVDDTVDAEAAFREWAGDLVEVVSFQETSRRQEDVEDRFRGVLRMLIIEAAIDIRYQRDFLALDREQTVERMLAPGGSTLQAFRDAELGRVFNPGMHEAGDRQTLAVSVIFETDRKRWRFLAVDHQMQLDCQRGVG